MPGSCGRSRAPLVNRSGAAEQIDVLVALVAAGQEGKHVKAWAEVGEQPLGGEECGAPFGVLDAPVAVLAELVCVPGAVPIEGGHDLLALRWKPLAARQIVMERGQSVGGEEEQAAGTQQPVH